MNRRSSSRYFDLSTLMALGLATLLLVSLPGGCGDSEDEDEVVENEETETEVVAEATEVPMLEIVEPEPGDLVTEPQDQEEGDAGEQGTEETTPDDGETGEENPEEEPVGQESSYVVQQGDTLYGIAVEFGVSMEDLMAANDMDNPDQLQVGQELQIP